MDSLYLSKLTIIVLTRTMNVRVGIYKFSFLCTVYLKWSLLGARPALHGFLTWQKRKHSFTLWVPWISIIEELWHSPGTKQPMSFWAEAEVTRMRAEIVAFISQLVEVSPLMNQDKCCSVVTTSNSFMRKEETQHNEQFKTYFCPVSPPESVRWCCSERSLSFMK